MSKKFEKSIEEALANGGFVMKALNSDSPVVIEPSSLQLHKLIIKHSKKGQFIEDPTIVPRSLQEANIFWHIETIVSAITQSGEEIPVYIDKDGGVEVSYDVVDPREKND